MTAIVGILNKRGAAIAADSAVTRTRYNNSKITKNGNKMIRLSNCVPISVMLTGNGDFLRTQWDIIVRYYRQHRGDIPHATVEACVHDFFRFIADNRLFCEEKIVKKRIKYELEQLFEHADNDVDFNVKERDFDGKMETPKAYLKSFLTQLRIYRTNWLKTGISEQFKEYSQEQFHEYIGDMITDYLFGKEFSEDFIGVNPYPRDFLDSIKNDLEMTLMVRLTTRRHRARGSAELVFTGFGTSQEYPSLVSAVVFEGFDNRVNYHIRPEDIICISDENPVAICPFAQQDVVKSLLRGLHVDYSEIISNAMSDIFRPFGNDIFKLNEDDKDFEDFNSVDFCLMLKEVKVNDLVQKFNNANIRYLNKKQRKWEKKLKDYDLLAMAALAQSLIDLTGFHRILTFSPEGVGGPVDLAVITKNEGFTWLSRKSWYHRKDIGGQYGVLGV
jgi:hypothetical protein